MRTHVPLNVEHAAVEFLSRYAQRREAFLFHIFYFGPETTQRIHEDVDGTMFHSLRTGYGMRAGCDGEEGGHEAHRRAAGLDVDCFGHVPQGVHDNLRVVAV